jgi:YD repeat-containing protein
VGKQGQLLLISLQWGSATVTYDLSGNTLYDGTNTYTWDARNRLVSADNNGATFSYDPLMRRIGKPLKVQIPTSSMTV